MKPHDGDHEAWASQRHRHHHRKIYHITAGKERKRLEENR